MSWFGFGDSIVDGIVDIAKEAIETDKETAEAKALFVKTLDPNGLMRRDISNKVSTAYMMYLGVTAFLILMQAFDIGNKEQLVIALKNLTEHFVGITAMFSAIVSASFGVNLTNSMRGK